MRIVSLIDYVINPPKMKKKLERILDAINTKNERNNGSSLPNWSSHFFPTLGFPTRIRIQIEFARPRVSDIYPDYFCYPGLLWEYWKPSMRRGGHLEYNIHGTTDLKYVWTKVQYSIFIKSPLRGSSDLIK